MSEELYYILLAVLALVSTIIGYRIGRSIFPYGKRKSEDDC